MFKNYKKRFCFTTKNLLNMYFFENQKIALNDISVQFFVLSGHSIDFSKFFLLYALLKNWHLLFHL